MMVGVVGGLLLVCMIGMAIYAKIGWACEKGGCQSPFCHPPQPPLPCNR